MPIILILVFALSFLTYQGLHSQIINPASNINIVNTRLDATTSNVYYYINATLTMLDESDVLFALPGEIDDAANPVLNSINYHKNGNYSAVLIIESAGDSYLLVSWDSFYNRSINPNNIIASLANHVLLSRPKAKPIIGINDNCVLVEDYTYTNPSQQVSLAKQIFSDVCNHGLNDLHIAPSKYIYLKRIS